MKVDVLVAKYKELNTDEEKKEFVERHIKTNYVNYEQKVTDVSSIVNIGNHTTIPDPSDETKTIIIYKKNTPAMYYLLKLTLLKNYSDIDIDITADDGSVLRAYNQLESIGFIDVFIALLPKEEVTKYHSMLEMANDDVYVNERDIASYLDTKIDAFGVVLNMMIGALGDFINKIEVVNEDENK